jgi:hypothetical protein
VYISLTGKMKTISSFDSSLSSGLNKKALYAKNSTNHTQEMLKILCFAHERTYAPRREEGRKKIRKTLIIKH